MRSREVNIFPRLSTIREDNGGDFPKFALMLFEVFEEKKEEVCVKLHILARKSVAAHEDQHFRRPSRDFEVIIIIIARVKTLQKE